MNREIKFRAWDGERYRTGADLAVNAVGYVIYQEDPKSSKEVKVDGEYYYDDWAKYNYKRDWILEQFTGLTDKNGKEIYEGDIVHIPGAFLDSNMEPTITIPACEVCFINGQFYLRCEEEELRIEITDYMSIQEVIGNIHEGITNETT